MNFAVINRLSINEDLLQYLAYGYSFNPNVCLYNDVCKDANDFLIQFDRLIDDFLKRSGIRRYVAGNVVLFADYEERKLQEDDIDYCDAVAAMFTIYGHQVVIRPGVMGLLSPNCEPKLSLDVKIPDYGNYHINRREAMGVIRQWVIDDQNNRLNGLDKHKRSDKVEKEQTEVNPYFVVPNKNLYVPVIQKKVSPIEHLRDDINKLASEVADIKAGGTRNDEKVVCDDQWKEIKVPQTQMFFSTEKAFKFQIPNSGMEYDGWCFWWPRKRVRLDRVDSKTLDKVYSLGYTNDQDNVIIERQRLKDSGSWEKETKTITIQQLKSMLEENTNKEVPF